MLQLSEIQPTHGDPQVATLTDERYFLGPEYLHKEEIEPGETEIFQFHTQFEYGGQVSAVGEEADALVDMGMRVNAITVQEIDEWSGKFPVYPIEYIAGHKPGDGHRRKEELYDHGENAARNALPIVLDQLAKSGSRAAILRGHHADGTLLAYQLHRRLLKRGIPSVVVATPHSFAEEKFDGTPADEVRRYRQELGGNNRRMVEYEIYRMISQQGILTTASPLQLYYLREYGIDPDNVPIIPPGINQGLFNTLRDDVDDWNAAEELGIKRGSRFIYAPGRMTDQKGQDKAMIAFAKVLPNHRDLTLVFTGGKQTQADRDYRAYLWDLAEKLGIMGNVVMNEALPQDKVASLYRICTMAAYLSKYDHFNMMLGEGAACGAPSLASDAMGATHCAMAYNSDGPVVMPVNPRDPGSIAQAMDAVVSNEGLRCTLSHNAVRWGRSLRAEHSATKILQLAMNKLNS